MTGFLARLFGRGAGGAVAAPLNSSLVLAASRRVPRGTGRVRASVSIGRWPRRRTFSVCELTDESGDEPSSTASLSDLVKEYVPRLDRKERAEVFDSILSAVSQDLDGPNSYALSKNLNFLRQRFHAPAPRSTLESGEPVFVDHLRMVDERSLWVDGWCIGGDETLSRLELISPEGYRSGPLDGAFRYPRPDVEEGWPETGGNHGFTKYLELSAPSHLSEGWIGELRHPSGSHLQVAMPPVIREPTQTRGHILVGVSADRPAIETLRRDHAYPALKRLQGHIRKSITIDSVAQYGDPPSSPEVSIIVPLYERIDLLEHQLAHFWQDPDLAAAELIYVLDSPQLGSLLARPAAELHALYGLPFKLLRLNRNAGFAAANNIGASHASGRLLLLLNSDVLPARTGWLETMRAFYSATPNVGALGPKLLYEDDSIQHAGMYFQIDPSTRFWENQHYYKGFSRSLAPANVTRVVPAVTGACLMVDRSLYNDVGGLCEDYIQGGYEDSDLCLRLIEAGRDNWYIAAAELYHLEAQSFPITLRSTNPYNTWLQTHLWSDRINQVMRAEAEGAEAHMVPVG
jgi:O-antigen biosynthesis protein